MDWCLGGPGVVVKLGHLWRAHVDLVPDALQPSMQDVASGPFALQAMHYMAAPTKAEAHVCARCHAAAGEGGGPLRACAACKGVLYCGKACQHADWRQHQRQCRAATRAADGGGGADATPPAR